MAIAIIGSTGQVGSEVAQLCIERGLAARLLVRSPEKIMSPLETVYFDYLKPETYPSALKGIERLFLVTTSGSLEHLKEFLAAAKKAGIKQIVTVSGIGAHVNGSKPTAQVEALTDASGVPSVHLRCNWFFQNFGSLFRVMIAHWREFKFPDGEAKISFVDARDIAEVALHLLTKPIPAKNEAYDITGPESLSHKEVAQLLSKYLPYEVRYRELTEDEAKEVLGWEQEWLDLFRDIRTGLTTPISNDVEKILNKPPRRLEAYIIENKALWLGD